MVRCLIVFCFKDSDYEYDTFQRYNNLYEERGLLTYIQTASKMVTSGSMSGATLTPPPPA